MSTCLCRGEDSFPTGTVEASYFLGAKLLENTFSLFESSLTKCAGTLLPTQNSLRSFVPGRGLEPPYHCWPQLLRLMCLPISPPRQVNLKFKIQKAKFRYRFSMESRTNFCLLNFNFCIFFVVTSIFLLENLATPPRPRQACGSHKPASPRFVRPVGIEPTTLSLRGICSTS